MSFFSHLDELRARLLRCAWVFVAGFALGYFFSDQFLEFLRRPLFDALPPDQQKLYFTAIFESFLVHLKIAGYASFFFCSPFFFYELWAFVAPGLYPSERRLMIPFVAGATTCFLGGAAFAYLVVFPAGFKFFVQYGGPAEVPLLTMDAYYGTALKLMLLFGAAFELPVIICLLGYVGILDSATLRRSRKNAILGITVVSALIAPPDAISMLLLMAPLILLYEVAIRAVGWLEKKRVARGQSPIPA